MLELQKEVLMQMRTTLRLPKICYMCLLMGHNIIHFVLNSYLSYHHHIPATPLVLRTLLWDYIVKRKLKIKEIWHKSYEFQHSLQSVAALYSAPCSSSKLPTSRLCALLPRKHCMEVKGRSSGELDVGHHAWQQTTHYALLCCAGGKGLTWEVSVGVSQKSSEHCFGNIHMGQ